MDTIFSVKTNFLPKKQLIYFIWSTHSQSLTGNDSVTRFLCERGALLPGRKATWHTVWRRRRSSSRRARFVFPAWEEWEMSGNTLQQLSAVPLVETFGLVWRRFHTNSLCFTGKHVHIRPLLKILALFGLIGSRPLKRSWKSFLSAPWQPQSLWMTQVNVRTPFRMFFCVDQSGPERFEPLFHPIKWRCFRVPGHFVPYRPSDISKPATVPRRIHFRLQVVIFLLHVSKTTSWFNDFLLQLVLRAQITPNNDILN